MIKLTIIFLKIFFRNPRTMFFVILLPAALFLAMAFLQIEGIIRFEEQVSYTDFLLIGIAAMAVMQAGIYTVAYTLIDYRRMQVLKRLSVTPLSAKNFLWAQVLSRFVIALLQVAILLLLGMGIFGSQIQNLWALPILLFIGGTVFLNFGFLIASIARDYEEAAPYTTLVGLPLVFLGDVFFPSANLPEILANLANFLPLKPLSSLLRHYLLGVESQVFLQDWGILLLWLVILSLVVQKIFSKKIYR